MQRHKNILSTSLLLSVALLSGCGDNKCKNGNCDTYSGGDASAIKATADLFGAFGLLIVDHSEKATLKLMDQHNENVKKFGLTAPTFSYSPQASYGLSETSDRTYQIGDEQFSFPAPDEHHGLALEDDATNQSSLQKIDATTGEITDALTQAKPPNGFDPNQVLPKLRTVAVSPTKQVFLQFERSFIYKDAPGVQDPWNPSNGYQCQIFRVDGGTLDDLLAAPPARENLLCLDNMHFIDSNRNFSNGLFQFDDTGNLYYPGTIPNVNKTVVYRIKPDGSDASEVINANICVQNFLITRSGGTFYTGQTCGDNGNNGNPGGDGFFRYVAPGTNGSVLEIARNWWNFIYAPSTSKTATDTAVFFGPDPRTANTASWNTACLFNFDPAGKEVNDRISETITCGNNIGDWMNMSRAVDVTTYGEGFNNYSGADKSHSPSVAWKQEFARRCESDEEVFAGGGSQISAIKQNTLGDVFVIGNIRKKEKGEVRCSVVFRGPHCTIADIPVLNDENEVAYTQTTCLADNGTWVNTGNCSNGTNKAAGCVDRTTRTWTAGLCSNPDYATREACVAATGCSNHWYNNQSDCTNAGFSWHNGTGTNFLVWRTGSCSSDSDKYETETACTAVSKIWRADTWSGACTSTDTADNAALYNNNQNGCIPNWSTDQVWYNNVTGSICTSADSGDRTSFWENNSKNNNFTKTADSTHSVYADLTGKYLVQNLECHQLSGASATNDWTTEYSALAQVNATKKTLQLLSLPREKAISLWVVKDRPYYSSFDTSSGHYLLNSLTVANSCIDTSVVAASSCSGEHLLWKDRRCFVENLSTEATCKAGGFQWQSSYPSVILSNFEVYNLDQSENEGELLADGLDFQSNQYKFGTINPANQILQLRTGLTGTLKTIVILPHTKN